MARRDKTTQIPPPFVVRSVALILIALDVVLITIVSLNISSLGLFGWLVLAGTIGTLYFPIKGLQTGDPEWVMLDLILGP